ncbi:putative kinase-like protein TMKL1 [Cocos nucifera]|nr:putative kinase-like protein TMKL1 [Cocos nucifera]
MLLRFVRPACVGRTKDILPSIQMLGLVRHPNLVPLRALYVGPRGEKLFVHPFYAAGTLSQFLRVLLYSSFDILAVFVVKMVSLSDIWKKLSLEIRDIFVDEDIKNRQGY